MKINGSASGDWLGLLMLLPSALIGDWHAGLPRQCKNTRKSRVPLINPFCRGANPRKTHQKKSNNDNKRNTPSFLINSFQVNQHEMAISDLFGGNKGDDNAAIRLEQLEIIETWLEDCD